MYPSSWIYMYPQGFRKLLLYIKEKYGNPPVYITENGNFRCHICFFDLLSGD
jgi:beta-glucosidase